MSIFDEADITWGVSGPPGAATVEQVADLEARVAAREAITIPTVTTDLTNWSDTAPSEGQLAKYTDGQWTPFTPAPIPVPLTIPVMADGSTGLKAWVRFKHAATITEWAVLANVADSMEWSILLNGASIVGSAPPKLVSQTSRSSTTLTGWTTSVAADDLMEIQISSAPATATVTSLQLHLTRTLTWGS